MNESKATRYQRLRRRAETSRVLSGGLMLALVAFSPVASWLRDLSRMIVGDLPSGLAAVLSLLLFVLFVVLLWEAAALPAILSRARSAGGGRSPESIAVDEILIAQLKAAGMTFAGAAVAAAVIIVSMMLAGAAWWVLAAVAMASLWAWLIRLGPFVLSRLAPVRPLSRADLGVALQDMARRVRVPVAGIDEWAVGDGTSTTALVTGVGGSRRVLVSSEIMRDWSDDEIAVVVAHELAHHAHHDLWTALAFNATVLCAGLGASHLVLTLLSGRLGWTGHGDLAALPMVALVTGIVWTVATPLRHAQSRTHERRADLFALRHTGAAGPFRAAIRRLGAQHLAEERPTRLTRWLHHGHPSVMERLAVADRWQKEG